MIQGRHDTYFTIDEVAAMAGVSVKTVQNWICEGVLRVRLLGRRRFVPLSILEAALAGPGQQRAGSRDVLRQMAFVARDVASRRRADVDDGDAAEAGGSDDGDAT